MIYHIGEDLTQLWKNLDDWLFFDRDYIIETKKKHKTKFLKLPCGFDIETTKIEEHTGQFTKTKQGKREKINRYSYMYIWQMSINNNVVLGRTWEQFENFLECLKNKVITDEETKLIIWVHNLSYESSFMLPRFYEHVTNGFYMEKRQPIYWEYDDCFRFQDSALISGCSLAKTVDVYNLKTKKLVGDLDYNIPRNSLTVLEPEEEQYCINDVVILKEFAEYIYNELAPANYNKIPLTKTQLVLNSIFHSLEYGELKRMMYHRPTYEEYLDSRQWLYRGGYVHANAYHVGKVLKAGKNGIDRIDSIDFTSSYPSVMLKCYMPDSKFYNKRIKDLDSFNYYINKKCCWFKVTFYNIKARYTHTLESLNKCQYVENPIIDNGRIYSADVLTVQLTELDWANYKEMYTFSSMKIHWFKCASRGQMNQHIKEVIEEQYRTKAQWKIKDKHSTNYKLSKEFVNSCYGAFVKKINMENWTIKGRQWVKECDDPKELYNRELKKLKRLNPMIGVWITAHARRNIVRSIVAITKEGLKHGENPCLYSDTDSIKLINRDKYMDFINAYNQDQAKLNKQFFGDDPAFSDLGFFDIEDGHYSDFCTLGSKRYAGTEDGELHTTISGLKKGIIKDMKDFTDGTYISEQLANKVTSAYNDGYHENYVTDLQGNTELMCEYGSCALYNVGFELSLSDEYKNFLTVNYGRKKVHNE